MKMKNNLCKNKRAFTLVELIVGIAMLAILSVLLFPVLSGYSDASKKVTCEQNLGVSNRSYLIARAQDESVSIKTVFENKNGKYYSGNTECPGDGNYRVKYSAVVCSKHSSRYDAVALDKELYDKTVEIRTEALRCDGRVSVKEVEACYTHMYNYHYFSDDHFLEKLYAENGNKWTKLTLELLQKVV